MTRFNLGQPSWIVGGLLIAAFGLSQAACKDDGPSACKDGEERNFECGGDKTGTQPQTCVEGTWYSTNFCANPDGTPHADDPWGGEDGTCDNGATRAAVCGEKNDGLQPQECRNEEWVPTNDCLFGIGGDGNGNGNNNFQRPTDPESCPEFTQAEYDAGGLKENTCYRLLRGVDIKNMEYTIEPGVTLFIANGVDITAGENGILTVEGTENRPVWFVGMGGTNAPWQGLVVMDESSGVNTLKHAKIQYAVQALRVRKDARVDVQNVEFIENQKGIVSTYEVQPQITVDASHFEGHDRAMEIPIDVLTGLSSNLTFQDNDDGVRILKSSTSRDGTWPALDVPYILSQAVAVQNDINVEPGAAFHAEQLSGGSGVRIDIESSGSLNADATGGDPIIFRSVSGDFGGDWWGLRFYSKTSNNVLKNVIVSNGGAAHFDRGNSNIYLKDAALELNDVTISKSAVHGIEVVNGSILIGCDGLVFEDIAQQDVAGFDLADCQ